MLGQWGGGCMLGEKIIQIALKVDGRGEGDDEDAHELPSLVHAVDARIVGELLAELAEQLVPEFTAIDGFCEEVAQIVEVRSHASAISHYLLNQ